MQINPFAASLSAASTISPAGRSASSSSNNPVQDTNNMFLTLLSAQLKNQTPFDTVDPMQFTGELVQFNMLDQLSQINSTLKQLSGSALPSTASPQPTAAVHGGR